MKLRPLYLFLLPFIFMLSCGKNNDRPVLPQPEADSILGDFRNYVKYGLPLNEGMRIIDTFLGRSFTFDRLTLDSFNNMSPYLFRFNCLGRWTKIRMTKEIARRYDSAKADFFPLLMMELHKKCICVSKGVRLMEPIELSVHRIESDKEMNDLNGWNWNFWYVILNKKQLEDFNETMEEDPFQWNDCKRFINN